MYVYVCMYVCMYVYCMYVCMHGWMDGCMYVCMDGWMDGCMYVCMYVCNVKFAKITTPPPPKIDSPIGSEQQFSSTSRRRK